MPVQHTLNFEPGLSDRWPSLKSCVRERVYANPKPLKVVAANMDLSESDLSRKVGGNPDDPRNFSVDDLEKYIESTQDVTPILYLVEKYAVSQDAKHAFAAAEFARMLPEMIALARQLGTTAPKTKR